VKITIEGVHHQALSYGESDKKIVFHRTTPGASGRPRYQLSVSVDAAALVATTAVTMNADHANRFVRVIPSRPARL
jgi:hypothetical protein